jgi:hypothetical protein
MPCPCRAHAMLWPCRSYQGHGTARPSRDGLWATCQCICSCSKAVHKPVWHIPLASVQWINSWWWAEELPETCRVSCQNKFVKLVHLVGFITKKFVTMQHGHMLRYSTVTLRCSTVTCYDAARSHEHRNWHVLYLKEILNIWNWMIIISNGGLWC